MEKFSEIFTKLSFESKQNSHLKEFWCNFNESKMVNPKELWDKVFAAVEVFLIKDIAELIVEYVLGKAIGWESFKSKAQAFMNEINSLSSKKDNAVKAQNFCKFLVDFRLSVFEHPDLHSMVMQKLTEFEADSILFPDHFFRDTRDVLNPFVVYS